MADLSGFRDKSFIEQISILDELESGQQFAAVPQLLELYQHPLGDGGVDQAVSDTLQKLLPGSPATVITGLANDDPRVRRLCANVAGNQQNGRAGTALAELASREQDPAVLLETLSALSKLDRTDSLPAFHRHLENQDPLIAALCVEALGSRGDTSAAVTFETIVKRAGDDDHFQHCDLVTSKAIGALEALATEDAIRFLVGQIHHRNPHARRLIIEGLTRLGAPVIPHLELLFDGDDVDAKIMAANVIGFIGNRSGGNTLIHALDRGKVGHANVRCAVYEALGSIPSMKGLVCLLDGLAEEEEILLLAVVTALEPQANPGIIGEVKKHLGQSEATASRILRAIVAAKATNLFQLLYDDEVLAPALVSAVADNKDAETLEVFRQKLKELGSPRAEADLDRLAATATSKGQLRLLVADDSKSMLMFYNAVSAQLDYRVETVGNGREALDWIERGEQFDLVVTDLNMPVMDGVQLTRQIRAGLFSTDVPILMVTTESKGSQVELARSAGVTDFIQKPLSPATFKAKIEEIID